mgnify:CR=1 FL=1
MVQEIYIIDNETEIIDKVQKIFKNDNEFKFKRIAPQKLDIVLKHIPSLIIVNEDSIGNDVLEICEKIRNDDDNNITPVIVCSSNKDREHIIQVLQKSIEHYLIKPIDPEYLFYTIKNLVRFMYINRRVSPLTGLPGNVQIHAELRKRLLNKEDFAILYLDLDNFKAYNDIYGFIKGDEIIKFTARIILEQIHLSGIGNSFVGHIGGDDFVAIVDATFNYEKICQNIIANFDAKVLNYFNEEDRQRGYIEV